LGFALPPRIALFGRPRRWAAALDVLLPPVCPLCQAFVDRPGLLCGGCYGQLTPVAEPLCACCGAPFELAGDAAEGGLCLHCADAPPPFGRARAALVYDKVSRRLVLPFKHGDRQEYALVLARLMAQGGRELLICAEVVVPVPLHRRRLFVRRYNQAALLAVALGRIAGVPVLVDGLARRVATESLGHKSAAERRDEVGGAFAVRPGRAAALAGRRVLLVDDVMTSGATVTACADVLLEAGAASVDVLVGVRVPDPRGRGRRRRSRQPVVDHVA
jgi:ComF family protein